MPDKYLPGQYSPGNICPRRPQPPAGLFVYSFILLSPLSFAHFRNIPLASALIRSASFQSIPLASAPLLFRAFLFTLLRSFPALPASLLRFFRTTLLIFLLDFSRLPPYNQSVESPAAIEPPAPFTMRIKRAAQGGSFRASFQIRQTETGGRSSTGRTAVSSSSGRTP